MIIGIDLGTTNSCAAYWKDGSVALIPNRLGQFLTPSAVSLDDGGKLIVGLSARERQSTHPKLTATSFKRYMGTERKITLGKGSYTPEELSSFVLRSIKEDAEVHLGCEVKEAIITVPAYFNDKQRKATRKAGELAGLKVERLVNEPTAAALAYGIHQLENEAQFLVFDLGGGTFDVSVVEIFEGIIEVRASTGDNRLGGEDFNEILMRLFIEKFGDKWNLETRSSDGFRQILRAAAEKARRAFSDNDTATMSIVFQGEKSEVEITNSEFEESCKSLLERLRLPVQRALRDSELNVADMDEIILIGGATRMPIVRRSITKMFGRFPAYRINPDEAVAIGAAVQTGLKARDCALKEVAITDVCPYSLGVDVTERDSKGNLIGTVFSPIIERNSVVPVSREEIYSNAQYGQTKIEFNIYQGESRNLDENIKLGSINIKIPPRPAGEVMVQCRFTYDINGLLEVDVFVPLTGKSENLLIFDESSVNKDDLEKQRKELAKLKFHPRDAEINQAAIARAERCYEEFLGDIRQEIGARISQFVSIIEQQNPKHIEVARKELSSFLDNIEGETFL